MTAKVILNPYSGRWSALRRKDDAMAALREAGVEFDLAVTEGPRHGIELAEEAARAGYSPIISAGGDGATGEVVNGLHRARPDGVLGPLGVMPLGTANDLVHNLGLLDLKEAARVIAARRAAHRPMAKSEQWVLTTTPPLGLAGRLHL
jgi:diacylglycerol kinase (ATP)